MRCPEAPHGATAASRRVATKNTGGIAGGAARKVPANILLLSLSHTRRDSPCPGMSPSVGRFWHRRSGRRDISDLLVGFSPCVRTPYQAKRGAQLHSMLRRAVVCCVGIRGGGPGAVGEAGLMSRPAM